MNQNITITMLEDLLQYYAHAIGAHVARSHDDPNGYYIDKDISGYRIEKVVKTRFGTGVDDVSPRGTKRDVWNFMQAGLQTLHQYHQNLQAGISHLNKKGKKLK